MRRDRSLDKETLSLFIILGILTFLFVLGARWALYDPSFMRSNVNKLPSIDSAIEATQGH